jgi:multiple antibiotic resistance protein
MSSLPSLASYALVSFGSVFSIVDPFTAVPVFMALVGTQPQADQRRIALRAALTCLVVLSVFGIAGSFIFHFFGITPYAFKIAGGILLFVMGFEMMRAQRSDTRTTNEEAIEAETKEDVGLIPLGLPLLSGPGAIATVMMLVGKAKDVPERLTVFGAVALVSFIAWLTLRSASFVSRVLGKTGMNVIGRVMGLILAAVAMQFVLSGLHEAFPKLLGAE